MTHDSALTQWVADVFNRIIQDTSHLSLPRDPCCRQDIFFIHKVTHALMHTHTHTWAEVVFDFHFVASAEEVGNVFGSVCLSVCLSSERIFIKFLGGEAWLKEQVIGFWW